MKRYVFVLTLLFLTLVTYGQAAKKYVDDGIFKCKIKAYSNAISVLNEAVVIDPYNSEAFYFRGVAKFEMGDYKSATLDFSKAISLNPNKFEAYYDRGIAKKKIGDYTGAREDFIKAKEINPNSSVDDYREGHKPDFTINDTTKIIQGLKRTEFLKMFASPDTVSYVDIGGQPAYSTFIYYNKSDSSLICFRMEEVTGCNFKKNGIIYSSGWIFSSMDLTTR